MPLNYSKWDQLELSDDSDIEEHPNVDKRSMINWKRRDIHEKREQRKVKIANLRGEVALNGILRPRLAKLRSNIQDASQGGRKVYSAEVERLKVSPSPDKPPTGHAQQPTYDAMILDLLLRIWGEAKSDLDKAGKGMEDETAWVSKLAERLEWHEEELGRRSVECEKEAAREEAEQKKKITSEDVHDGFSVGHVLPNKPSPMDDVKAVDPSPNRSLPKPKEKVKETAIEVLNPGASSSKITAIPPADEDPDADAPVPVLTPAARAFTNLPLRAYDKCFAFIQNDPSVLVESTTDACLGEAFEAELKGEKDRAKRCVERGLMIQYCRKLGRDGVKLFFQRMQQGGPKAESVFQTDVSDTYTRMEKRCVEMRAETAASGAAEDRETIQLVAEDESTEIGFNILDGPPPEHLTLEGEGIEDLDVEEVKRFLNRKWEIFDNFPMDLREAMKTESLVEVNKVLGKMQVEDAERVVELMQEGGMLSFSESGVRDMTGK